MNPGRLLVIVLVLLLSSCATIPPSDVNNICSIFRQYPKWKLDARDVEHRWGVPVSVQMAIIHQESKFNSKARPARTKLLWVIPWTRPSDAYGYTQALSSTWKLYKKADGGFWATRDDFADAVDFIGWYVNQANKRAGISRSDAYSLYLAYHDGIGGYMKKTWSRKPWLMQVARKVRARSQIYQAQLNRCS